MSAFSSILSNERLSALSYYLSRDLLEYRDFERSFLELASGLYRRDFSASSLAPFLARAGVEQLIWLLDGPTLETSSL
jgi:hypothetical protein